MEGVHSELLNCTFRDSVMHDNLATLVSLAVVMVVTMALQ